MGKTIKVRLVKDSGWIHYQIPKGTVIEVMNPDRKDVQAIDKESELPHRKGDVYLTEKAARKLKLITGRKKLRVRYFISKGQYKRIRAK